MAIVFGSNAARQILRRDCIKLRGYDPDKLHPKKFPGRYIAGAWEIESMQRETATSSKLAAS